MEKSERVGPYTARHERRQANKYVGKVQNEVRQKAREIMTTTTRCRYRAIIRKEKKIIENVAGFQMSLRFMLATPTTP
jgi:hypothetical protein